MEVPYVLEKIVEKITVMPQIVEVLKHVHEIVEEDNINILCDLDVEVTQYKEMSVALEREMPTFLEEIRRLKTSGQYSGRIDFLQRYVSEFKRYLAHPKLFQKIREVKTEPEKEIVRISAKTSQQTKEELSRALLIEQLLAALRKIGVENRNINLNTYLDTEVMNMFSLDFSGSVSKVNSSVNSSLKKFSSSIESKFSKLNGWGTDHNHMLKSFIDERFQLASVIKGMK